MHLDPAERGVVERVVPKAAQVEVGAQLPVDAYGLVQIEHRSHTLRPGCRTI
jgi:hypothetical protein